jgi:hypothetical protein
MNKQTWAVAVGLLVAFALGWLGAELRNVGKVPVGKVVTDQWQSDLFKLVKNRINHEPVDPASMIASAKWRLDLQSVTLASAYDGLPSYQKQRIAGDLPAARAIVARWGGDASEPVMPHLAIFIECVEKAQSHGGSVYQCANEHERWRAKPKELAVAADPPDALR